MPSNSNQVDDNYGTAAPLPTRSKLEFFPSLSLHTFAKHFQPVPTTYKLYKSCDLYFLLSDCNFNTVRHNCHMCYSSN